MKPLVFFSLFPIAFSSLTGSTRDAGYVPSLDTLGGQSFQSQLAGMIGMKIPPQYHHGGNPETSAVPKGSSHKLQRRGACISKQGCSSPQTREGSRSSASQSNRTPDQSTRSTGTQTATPPNSPRGHLNSPAAVPVVQRAPSQHSIAGIGDSEPRRSNSFTAESRDKVGELSRTNTGIKSGLPTPGNSRPSSAESRRQSATSGISFADSIGILQGDDFVPHDQRRQRMDGSGSRRPSSAGAALQTTRLPERPASAETVGPKDSRRPSSAGSTLPRMQTTQQKSGRPTSADTVAPKGWVAGSEQSYGSRRSSATSDYSTIARWSLGG